MAAKRTLLRPGSNQFFCGNRVQSKSRERSEDATFRGCVSTVCADRQVIEHCELGRIRPAEWQSRLVEQGWSLP